MSYGFKDLKPILESFSKHGHKAYIVGGSARDILLSKKTNDVDIASDAKPEKIVAMFNLTKVDPFTFKFGSLKATINEIPLEITTLRKESDYKDFRHPQSVEFIKEPSEDSNRRDFTINALYLDKDGKVLDFHNGQKDLQDKVIRIIGEPTARLKEDPVRILRALRFSMVLGFDIEPKLLDAIKTNQELLNEVSEFRIKDELMKLGRYKKNNDIKAFLSQVLSAENKVMQLLTV
jgi:tRNA nucleotidyltransferase (CCA-adding enzyme)